MQGALDFLLRIGTLERGHARGSLHAHLIGTWELLHSWGCEPSVCLAGLYHSVYGTNFYELQSFPLQRRQEIRGVIGAEAEELVFLFCVADRPHALWDACQIRRVIDRLTGTSYPVSSDQAIALIEIECANCLEQGLGWQFLEQARKAVRIQTIELRPSIAAALAQVVDC